ncbi:MAG: aminotransferase class I/II-fold pyridoxal phosphate-dependent enzyme, partial [Sulfurimonadaceae bacterium]|nr:aminotransferase class I/II-fold pyridoxal phosphate-dependent enzyme [Sulfurimonadaceae bacterium]
LCSPSNPQGAVASRSYWRELIALGERFDFQIFADECYSEIYTSNPVPSLLEAAKHVGNDSYKNVLVINSISKRSSAPGLRSGFIAGDAEILKGYMKYRTYVGCASPLPLQTAAAAAWADEQHVADAREVYKRNFAIAKEVLGVEMPEATFYIWLKVDNALEFTKRLYNEYNVKVLPGEFLARDDENGNNPGKGYVRIALVENEARTKEALERVKRCMA